MHRERPGWYSWTEGVRQERAYDVRSQGRYGRSQTAAQMRWVVLVDKRQLAVLLLGERGNQVASATDTLATRGDMTTETSRSTQWSAMSAFWLTRRCVSGVLCRPLGSSSTRCRRADEAGGVNR